MPEGHTLHRLARDLTDAFAGQVVGSSSPQGRFAAEAERINGHRFLGAEAVGKHLLVEIEGLADQVHVHLGLYGKFRITRGEAPITGQVRWRLTADHTADLRGPTACELLSPPEVDAIFARLGPDPLRDDADPDRAWHRIHRSSAPIATLLMDQKVLAGVGNVYRAEILFRHRVPPMMAGRRLSKVRWTAMWDDLVVLMHEGVESGRIETLRPEDEAPGIRGRAKVYVYRRDGDPCRLCGTTVRTRVLAGRNLFWCPSCQSGR